MNESSIKTQPTFYSVNDIQKLMKIGRNTAYTLVNEKGFPAIYVGNRIIIPADLFNEWINKKVTQKH